MLPETLQCFFSLGNNIKLLGEYIHRNRLFSVLRFGLVQIKYSIAEHF